MKNKKYRKPLVTILIAFLIVTAVLLPTRDGMLFKRLTSIKGELQEGIYLEEGAGVIKDADMEGDDQTHPRSLVVWVGPDHLYYYGAFFQVK